MFRYLFVAASMLSVFSRPCWPCECISAKRPCEYLRADVVFVGHVIETTAVRHPIEKQSWTDGYSMRFSIDEPLMGELGTEATVETGNGGGDCGTPLTPGGKFLLFAFREKDGKLWTGMCSGNRRLNGDADEKEIVEEYRSLTKQASGTVFGQVTSVRPHWREDDVDDESGPKPVKNLILQAVSGRFSASTQTRADGSYEFSRLPAGKYTVQPLTTRDVDFDREEEDRYKADIAPGRCLDVSFKLEPNTRIHGRVIPPPGVTLHNVQVVAIPTHLTKLNQYSGKWDIVDGDGHFDLWPLPPGEYYVGVNINSSPSANSPFPPTYYPGVTNRQAANVIKVNEGEQKEIDLPLPEVAAPRTIHFVAVGVDGKPLKAIYIQLEDLRHPGDASSYVNVDLDGRGAGIVTVYSGYNYHLHGSHWVSYGNDWCSKPVTIPAGTGPLDVQFIMDRKAANCQIDEIDRLRK